MALWYHTSWSFFLADERLKPPCAIPEDFLKTSHSSSLEIPGPPRDLPYIWPFNILDRAVCWKLSLLTVDWLSWCQFWNITYHRNSYQAALLKCVWWGRENHSHKRSFRKVDIKYNLEWMLKKNNYTWRPKLKENVSLFLSLLRCSWQSPVLWEVVYLDTEERHYGSGVFSIKTYHLGSNHVIILTENIFPSTKGFTWFCASWLNQDACVVARAFLSCCLLLCFSSFLNNMTLRKGSHLL